MVKPFVPGYVLTSKVGSGTFADVFKANRIIDPKEVVAIKCIRKGELRGGTVESIITEIKTLKLLRHPHIIQMYDFLWDENYIYVIMEYCEGGDLSIFIKIFKQLKENICKQFISQLASALQFLRQNNIVHMDLKPQNLLLTSKKHPVLKLTDFGLALSIKNQESETSVRGSPLYMAPEILLGHSYNASVDLWSTGIILYECIFGKTPYTSKSLKDLIEKIKKDCPISLPDTPSVSLECRDLLTKLLQKDPQRRLKYEDFFAHSFIKSSTIPLPHPSQKEDDNIFERAKVEKDDGVKSQLQGKIDECSLRLKMITSSNTVATSQYNPSEVAIPSRTVKERPQLFKDLHSLASSTPSLMSALDIGIEGVSYDSEGQHALALERYKAALDKLIPVLRNETKGRRRELLHQQITLWMERAEQIQKHQDYQQPCLQEQKCDNPGQCGIQ